MKKFLIIIFITFIGISGCDKPSGGGIAQPTTKINSPALLSKNLNIEGAIRKTGDIPEPEGSEPFGILDFEVLTPSVILTSGSSFDFEIESTNSALVLFIKIDSTNEHFMLTVDADGNVVGKSANGSRNRKKIVQCCSPPGSCGLTLTGKPLVMSNMNVGATVQVYQPPLQGKVPDMSFINNRQYWSPPIRCTYKTFPTGTGDVYTTLTWNKEGDIDLWLKEPNGFKIYYGDKISLSGGELDYDNVDGYGPENIFYNSTPPSGKYEIWVHYFSGVDFPPAPVDWVVTLKNGSSFNTYRGTLTNENDSVQVVSFIK